MGDFFNSKFLEFEELFLRDFINDKIPMKQRIVPHTAESMISKILYEETS